MTDPLARMTVSRDSVVDGGRVVVRLVGEIDMSNATELERWIDDAIGGHHAAAVDLTAVQYMDSQCVRVLERLAQRHSVGELDLVMVAAPDSIARDVITLTQLHQVVPVLERLP
jgi:anti-anti-sigma factor